MRPVNLIPPEDRGSDWIASRSGILPYVVIGCLAVLMFGVVGWVVTGNQIADRKTTKADLQQRKADAEAQKAKLADYASFLSIRETRVATVHSLAASRFDWEKVLRQLAKVTPSDIGLTSLTGKITSGSSTSSGATPAASTAITGPSLSLAGCGRSHDAVARFIVRVKAVDKVTRVGLPDSTRTQTEAGTAAGSGTGVCRGVEFHLDVAFDDSAVTITPPSVPATPGAGATPATATAGTGNDTGLAAAPNRARGAVNAFDRASQTKTGTGANR